MRMPTATISQPHDIATQPRTNKRARSIAFAAGAAALPVALGVGATALLRSRRAGLLACGISAAMLAAFRWQLQRWFTDQPAYVIERRIGDLEIRRYPPHVEAQTRIVELEFETALEQGFRRIAAYIFGGNSQKQDIPMTTPVLNTPRAATHSVAFVMPPGKNLSSLPRPKDANVELVEVPERRVAVVKFRGRYKDDVMMDQTRRLQELVTENHLEALGQPTFAGYDPPSTLPFLRRTEIWVEVA